MNARLVRLLPFVSLLAANLLADPLDTWHTHRIEATSDLDGASSWQPLTTVLLANSPFVWRENGPNLPDKRLYRAVWGP
jgi:hypothetical protein